MFFRALLIISSILTAGVSWAQERPLTIDAAVQAALTANTTVRAQREEVAAARARVQQAEAARLPAVDASVEYSHTSNLPTFELPSLFPGQPAETISTGTKDNIIAAIEARQALYTGGRIRASITQAEALYDTAIGTLGATEADIALATRRAYYNVLLAQRLIVSAQQNLDAASSQLATATARFEAGAAPKFDVLRAQTQVSEAEQSLVEAQNQERIAYVVLDRLMSRPQSETPPLVDPGTAPFPTGPLDALVTQAESRRAEVLAARANLAASKAGVRVAASERSPQVGASARYEKVNEESSGLASGWTLGLNAAMPIFDGGRIRANVREAEALQGRAQVDLEDTLQSVEQNVRNAYSELSTSRQTIDTARARLAQAQEAYQIALVRYEAGVGTATELADALAELSTARTNLDQAIFNYNAAYSALLRALGEVK